MSEEMESFLLGGAGGATVAPTPSPSSSVGSSSSPFELMDAIATPHIGKRGGLGELDNANDSGKENSADHRKSSTSSASSSALFLQEVMGAEGLSPGDNLLNSPLVINTGSTFTSTQPSTPKVSSTGPTWSQSSRKTTSQQASSSSSSSSGADRRACTTSQHPSPVP